jgi:hypothetical protein
VDAFATQKIASPISCLVACLVAATYDRIFNSRGVMRLTVSVEWLGREDSAAEFVAVMPVSPKPEFSMLSYPTTGFAIGTLLAFVKNTWH